VKKSPPITSWPTRTKEMDSRNIQLQRPPGVTEACKNVNSGGYTWHGREPAGWAVPADSPGCTDSFPKLAGCCWNSHPFVPSGALERALAHGQKQRQRDGDHAGVEPGPSCDETAGLESESVELRPTSCGTSERKVQSGGRGPVRDSESRSVGVGGLAALGTSEINMKDKLMFAVRHDQLSSPTSTLTTY
jgi:hypothetical protein